jgi:hypothetical protein
MTDSCDNCRFSFWVDTHVVGHMPDGDKIYLEGHSVCRRYPEQSAVPRSRWCGEHRLQENLTADAGALLHARGDNPR